MRASTLKLINLLENCAGNTRLLLEGEYGGGEYYVGTVKEFLSEANRRGREHYDYSYAENISIGPLGELRVGVVEER